MDQDWKIKVVGQDVVESQGSILTLEWTLNQRPDQEWVPFLEHSSVPKSGSAIFTFHDPRVSGNKVRMVAEDRDIESAASYMEKSISFANERFEAQIIARRQREQEQMREQGAAREARLEQAREHLRRADSSDTVG